MADWDGKYISPYAEHGKKSEQVKKITVSIPIKVLEILTNERTRVRFETSATQPIVNYFVKHFYTHLLVSLYQQMKIF